MRNTALLATALLVDLKLVTKDEAHLIVDPSKIQRARDKVMKEERLEAKKDLEEVKVVAVFVDGRKDKTKMIIEDEDGDEFARTVTEEHYTLTDPNKYLTHVTPDEGSGAKGTAEKVLEFLSDVKQLENDWSEAELMEPVLTCFIPTEQLDQYVAHPFLKLNNDCHTQACERAVTEITIAASKVFGFERRDGLIRAKLKSRKLVSSIKSKKILAGMLG